MDVLATHLVQGMLRPLPNHSNQPNEMSVIYAIVTYFIACLVDLLTVKWMSDDEKDLEAVLGRGNLPTRR